MTDRLRQVQRMQGSWLDTDDSVELIQMQPSIEWQQQWSAEAERGEEDADYPHWPLDPPAELSLQEPDNAPTLPSFLLPTRVQQPPPSDSLSTSVSSSSSLIPHRRTPHAYADHTPRHPPHQLTASSASRGTQRFQYLPPIRGVSSGGVERQVLEMLRSQPALRLGESLLMTAPSDQVLTAGHYLRLTQEFVEALTSWDLVRFASLIDDRMEMIVSSSLPSPELAHSHFGFAGYMRLLSVLLSFVTITNISFKSVPMFCRRQDCSKVMQVCTQRGCPRGSSLQMEWQQFNFLTWQHSNDRLIQCEFYLLDQHVAEAITQQQQQLPDSFAGEAVTLPVVASVVLPSVASVSPQTLERAAEVSAAATVVSPAAADMTSATCKLWLLLPSCEHYLPLSVSAALGQRGVSAICSSCQLTVVRPMPGSQTVFVPFAVEAERLLLLRLVLPPAEATVDKTLLQHELKLDQQGLHKHRNRSLRLDPAAIQQLQQTAAPAAALGVKRLTVEQSRSSRRYVYVMRSVEEAQLAAAHFLHRAASLRIVRLHCYALLQPLWLKYQHQGQEIRIETQQQHKLKSGSDALCRQL